jgi:hypothetical protein
MSGNTTTLAGAAKQDKAEQGRQRSSISFPYTDLGAGFDLALAIHSHVGHGDCEEDQLAVWTDQSPKSSGFREQLRVARMSGLIEADNGRWRLSELGRSVADPNQAVEAKARAFLNVPLFKAVFEKYRGTVLPPTAALERDIVALGVSEKQRDRARQVLEKSAEQTGFFEHGRNRLVMPAVASRQESPSDKLSDKKGGGGDEPPSGEVALDPLLIALLKKVPPPEKGWPGPARVRWFRTFAMNVSQIYDGDGEPVEMKIELEDGSN